MIALIYALGTASLDRYHIASRAEGEAAIALLSRDKDGNNRRVRLETTHATR